ncbi:MAG: ABC transporter ATP-binding protein [Planctomycetes bacterium]|nr:ABC transporter ATP-binding protein [Planctomycetota bacterium]
MSEALEVRGLRVSYATRSGWRGAVAGVDLRLERGAAHSIVGESGCGKSSLALALLGLVRTGGRREAASYTLDGRAWSLERPETLRELRGRRVGLLLQESAQALDPRLSVERHLRAALGAAREGAGRERVLELLARVGFDAPVDLLARLPHELSGGMRQRVQLACALATGPSYLIADEPTASLDALLARRIVTLLASLVERERLGVLMVTHDLAAAAELGGALSVMYAGTVVERGPARELLLAPRHPYTEALIAACAAREPFDEPLRGLPGAAPQGALERDGCAFAARCPLARGACRSSRPTLLKLAPGRELACPPRAEGAGR